MDGIPNGWNTIKQKWIGGRKPYKVGINGYFLKDIEDVCLKQTLASF